MKIVITGHRPSKLNNEWNPMAPGICTKYVAAQIKNVMIENAPECVISGMALGTDTIAALVALKLRIPLTVAIPCSNQSSRWTRGARNLWDWIVNASSHVEMVSTDTYDECLKTGVNPMQARNIWMAGQLSRTDILLAGYDGSKGGTQNMLYSCKDMGHEKMFIINPKGYLL